jgi:predicted extracellular nuclease
MAIRRSAPWTLVLLVLAACSLVGGGIAQAQTVFINEIHYDNAGTDAGEAIEIAGPAGTDLTGWSLVLYNGNGGAVYDTRALTGTISGQQNGFGTLTFEYPVNGIQNGSPDGIALVDPTNTVVQFMSYEGVFTAVGGPANGLTSTDIGVSEAGSEPVGQSLQLRGTGTTYTDFVWAAAATSTFGAPNTEQTFRAAPPIPVVTIMQIQGAGHVSPLVGQRVSTTGVVTVAAGNGFYLQDLAGDDDASTSDGIFVFTSSMPSVAPGDQARVVGTVTEFIPGGAATNNLSITELTQPLVTVLATGQAVPAPTLIGVGGRLPPTQVIDDDGFAVFDPAQDGIDFYESLEGMLVEVGAFVAVSPRNDFGEVFGIAQGSGATGRNARGGLTVAPGDFNPERIQIDDTLLPGGVPAADVGDRLDGVVGVMSYNFGNFEVLVTRAPVLVPSGLARETTGLVGRKNRLTVASLNLENLDPGDGPRIGGLADVIVNHLRAPDIVAVQEIQDNSGPTNDGVVDATATFEALVLAIVAAGGPAYEFRDIPPVDGQDGGEPGGNIRVGFLFNPDRVAFVDRGVPSSTEGTEVVADPTGTHVTRSPGRIDPGNAAFLASRKPLVGEFVFARRNRLFLVANHFTSKTGSSPLFGALQPPIDAGSEQREAQAEIVNGFVRALLGADRHAKVVVLGDLNDFYFSAPLEVLRGGTDPILTNLHDRLPPVERYTFVFEGNAQTLDHILVSDSLARRAEFDVVHANAEFAEQPTDHDPPVARLTLLPGDFDGDGCVDIPDFLILLKALLHRSADTVTYDFSNDGRVNFLDVPAFLRLLTPHCH